ncbi:putative glycerol kinase 5 [Sitodiplosis mosellana]|uniref:putative glycerol kinase 5 n=1 Tax=Sitodiplosis mosellana TaxID=263140 RepID=UPI0024438D13|nr:putative glycerol kinase 5 [Sitodiplosis mosellana]XP_055322196.1 putative glycerol kinase 5 [Sitodiplosis mosellana]XP_055322197.1 putative glycerol kinase 5 [Sitodiplosis mosellana]XP_055322198.1 putative glycerol kinase 5 [Sitodiplosis mosellana]XP_055322199.1 putative glycerol kinase 5 [Sitodiplosis mosellana]XP_055322200.1 putative glycerol kinase 5 [Sitodiplosis mosellana]XP_055322201.1 putative glycerol kinase 5 [Sitodiplosis mosellana]XP_055322202.1 putative glycerol kinase 5 [Sit
MSEKSHDKKYIASLDIGTTSIRCFIYDINVNIVGKACANIELLYPQPGYVEINPDELWQKILKTIQNAISDAQLNAIDISCLGISTQRSTFITWDRTTGETFHNFITWKDLRADSMVRKWNDSVTLKLMHGVSHFLYMFTRNKRFLAGSVLKLMNAQTTLRLSWMIQNNKKLQAAIEHKNALFGTLDSWLLYRLRQGNDLDFKPEHISDVTSCSATGFYDPFTLQWAKWALNLFSIKANMLPTVVDNSYNFGHIHRSLLGHEIPIGSSLGDQSASMWGSCCFNTGDIKITLGTGSFLNLNTGSQCPASIYGLYPLVAWRYADKKNTELVYCMEGAANDTGSIIQWAMNFGLFQDPSKSADIANSVDDTEDVYFVPAFSGLGAPINDHQAASGLIGIRPSTKNAHIVRAILESIAFRLTQLYTCTQTETNFKFSVIRVDGGVSKNDFICQLLADLTKLKVERAFDSELSALGAGFLAGLRVGIWNTRDELVKLRKVERVFVPNESVYERSMNKMKNWERAVNRFKGWYQP